MINVISRAAIAASCTLAIFFVMSYLVKPGEMPPEPGDKETVITVTRKDRSEETHTAERVIPPPPKMQDTPPPPVTRQNTVASLNKMAFNMPAHTGPLGPSIDMSITNRRAIPIVSFPPEYPQRQLQNNIEGWVLLEFTITADGSVAGIEVVDADPENAFERSAIRALQKWSYQPKMMDGRAVPQHHMQEIFRFEIKK